MESKHRSLNLVIVEPIVRKGFEVLMVFMFHGLLTPLQAQNSYNLEQCLDMVRASSATFQQITLDTRIHDLQQKILTKNYLPQASFGAKASWQSEVTSLPIELPNFDVPQVPKEQFSFAIDVNQMIFDGGVNKAFSEIKTSETEMKILQNQSGILEWEKQGINMFYQIALQQKLLEINDLLIGQLDQNIAQAEVGRDAGILIKQDVLNIEVKRLEAVQQNGEYQAQLHASSRALARLMNTEDTLITVLDSKIDDLDDDRTFKQRPEIRMLDVRTQMIAAQEQLAVAETQPKANAFLTTGYGRPGLNFLSDQFDFYALAGIKLAVPLDHLYSQKTSLQRQSFRLEQESVQLSKEDVAKRFSNQAVSYREEINKLTKWISEDHEIIQMREQMLTTAKAQWEGGTLSTIQYLNHLTDLSLARVKLSTHQIMLDRAYSLLANLSGKTIDIN